jgi:hypothetical protein
MKESSIVYITVIFTAIMTGLFASGERLHADTLNADAPAQFNKVRAGMTHAEVRSLVGFADMCSPKSHAVETDQYRSGSIYFVNDRVDYISLAK